jgi:NTP pyrophosphatase (non-canonical NTP hydrolase)
MKDIIADEFQYTVQELLFRNKSIIDSMTKFQDSNARVNRAIVKAVTQCGCIRIDAKKQEMPEDGSFEEVRNAMDTHVSGKLCENCRDQLEKELGKNLFYMASICNTLDLNLYDIILKEQDRVKMLGRYNLG